MTSGPLTAMGPKGLKRLCCMRGCGAHKTGPGWEVRGPQEREDVLGPGASSGVGDPVARIPAGEGGRARVPSQGVGPGVRPGPEEREAVRTQGLR